MGSIIVIAETAHFCSSSAMNTTSMSRTQTWELANQEREFETRNAEEADTQHIYCTYERHASLWNWSSISQRYQKSNTWHDTKLELHQDNENWSMVLFPHPNNHPNRQLTQKKGNKTTTLTETQTISTSWLWETTDYKPNMKWMNGKSQKPQQ